MQEVFNYTQDLTDRISPIVENLFRTNSLYLAKLKKRETVEMLVELFAKFSPEEMRAIQDDELIKRIDSILALDTISGTLDNLTPEQVKMYDEAVEGR